MSDTAQWLDVVSFRQRRGQEKTYPHTVGAATIKPDGTIMIFLNSLPIPDGEGQVKLTVRPRASERGYGRGSAPPQDRRMPSEQWTGASLAATLDDDLPPWT